MSAPRPRPAVLRALGPSDPPESVEIGGRTYQRVEIFKHDSWAATAKYRGDDQSEVVCKFNRRQSIFGFPMGWLGRWLARREQGFLQRLAGVNGIPAESGDVVVEGQRLLNAVAHEYIPGHPLARGESVAPGFYESLHDMLAQLHQRGVAYVDLHKPENIIVGRDGRPNLIDFQVCFAVDPNSSRSTLRYSIFQRLRNLDIYHFAKHVRHCETAPQELVSEEQCRRPRWISVHRMFAVPLRKLRRGLLTSLRVRGADGHAGSEAFPEDAVRRMKRNSESSHPSASTQERRAA